VSGLAASGEAPAVDLSDIVLDLGALQTREEFAASVIREAIIRGRFRPGQRLAQDLIAASLGISRMPVRASLRRLETEGLVEFHPYRGASVRLMSPEEIGELYDLRILLERYLIEEIARRCEPDALGVLDEHAARVGGPGDQPRDLGWVEERNAFYDALYELAERPRIGTLVAGLRREVGPYLALRATHGSAHVHLAVFHLLRRGEVTGAVEEVTRHLLEVKASLQEVARVLAAAG
jgi:DNA-binding GntR family transcriptional regulator